MWLPWILGFQSLFYVLLMVGCLVFRQKWKNAVAKKEEIMRLVDSATNQTAMAEFEASAGYACFSSVQVASVDYQCAVCYKPTTMRCSRCKAIRYCSGKCQIIHWRRGHKDECYPSSAVMHNGDESTFERIAVSHKESESSDSDGMLAGVVPSGEKKSSFTPPVSSSDDSYNRVEDPTHENYSSENDADNMYETELATSSSVNNANLAKPEVKASRVSKRSKKHSIHMYGDIDHRTQLAETKTAKSHDMTEALGSKKQNQTDSIEQALADGSRQKTSASINLANLDARADAREESVLDIRRTVRSSSSKVVHDHLSLGTTEALNPQSKPAKYDGYHSLSSKRGGVPALSINVRNGLRTSVRKVVQHLKGSKESKSSLFAFTNEMVFPYEVFVELYYCDKLELYPFGLTNCGNSCYANAVLQCLAYTRPLTSYLLQGFHSQKCRKKGWCFFCEFESLILKAKEGNSPLSPIGILSKIHNIGSHLGHGREEDAHEFLRCAVDTMQSDCLREGGIGGSLAEETTLIGHTFAGFLRSKIKCLKCLGKSERYERMMDLTVEIDGDIGSLEEALAQFTAPEILEKDNKYHCSRSEELHNNLIGYNFTEMEDVNLSEGEYVRFRCHSYEKARKKLTILEAPNILTIVLKRFQSTNFEKLNKPVQFPEYLNMAPYMSGTRDKAPFYSLYAVVVHLDSMNSSYSGHYICYVKDFRGAWFRVDDSRVEPVESQRVLSESAYMLLYSRHTPKAPGALSSNAISEVRTLKRRNLEAVPSSYATSKSRYSFTAPEADLSKERLKHMKKQFQNSTASALNTDEWRLRHSGRPTMDYSSESSSLFGGSDASSCSTASTVDSSSTTDLSDYIFGDMGPNWYRHYGLSSDMVPSSSHLDSDTDLAIDGDDPAVLHADRFQNYSSTRETDPKMSASLNNIVHSKRASRSSARTFY